MKIIVFAKLTDTAEEDKVRELINVDEVKHDLAINKAIDFIKSHANVVEKAAEAEKTEDAQ